MNIIEKITDKLFRKQWHVGLAKIDIADIILKKSYPVDYKWLPIKTADRFYADPFIFKSPEGQIHVIYEDFSVDDLYGKISLTIVDEQLKPVFTKEMLDTKSHLSYPNVFIEDGKTYIIPEASKSGNVTCYEFDFDTKSLINGKTIVQNLPLLDSTILVHNNKYWLFATKRGENSNSKLYIYHSNELTGPYVPHSANPVKDSLNGTRPAGNFIKLNGDIYRPSQNCAEYYGKSVTINKITLLTENEFEEEVVREICPPPKSGFNYGIHTINVVGDVIVIDALKRMFMPLEQIQIFLKKILKKKKKTVKSSTTIIMLYQEFGLLADSLRNFNFYE